MSLRTSRNAWASLLATASLSVLPMFEAQACRCLEPTSTSRAYSKADAIVLATVQAVDGEGTSAGGARAHLKVTEAWKVAVSTDLDVHTHSTCAFDFQPGQAYLVYLERSGTGPGWSTRICMGNRKATEADVPLRWLRAHGKKVAPKSRPASQP